MGQSETSGATVGFGTQLNGAIIAVKMTAEPDVNEQLSGAEDAVRQLLNAIAGHRWVNLRVPHGFTITNLQAAREPSWFPEGTEHTRVTAHFDVPVIFNARNGRATDASRENLAELRAWIEEECAAASARIALREWSVQPQRDPEPRRDKNEPDQLWDVTAAFDLAD